MSDGHFTPQMQLNSQHQLWSHWVFVVDPDLAKLPSITEVRKNARLFFLSGFGQAGRVRVMPGRLLRYVIEVQIEGVPAHDPDYRAHVKRQFLRYFMVQGFGYGARLLRFDVKVLAGDQQDGRPPEQMIVIPTIPL